MISAALSLVAAACAVSAFAGAVAFMLRALPPLEGVSVDAVGRAYVFSSLTGSLFIALVTGAALAASAAEAAGIPAAPPMLIQATGVLAAYAWEAVRRLGRDRRNADAP